jgi:hypothetical protein
MVNISVGPPAIKLLSLPHIGMILLSISLIAGGPFCFTKSFESDHKGNNYKHLKFLKRFEYSESNLENENLIQVVGCGNRQEIA